MTSDQDSIPLWSYLWNLFLLLPYFSKIRYLRLAFIIFYQWIWCWGLFHFKLLVNVSNLVFWSLEPNLVYYLSWFSRISLALSLSSSFDELLKFSFTIVIYILWLKLLKLWGLLVGMIPWLLSSTLAFPWTPASYEINNGKIYPKNILQSYEGNTYKILG